MARARQHGRHFLETKSSVGPLLIALIYLILILVQPDTGGFAINFVIIAVMILACDMRWAFGVSMIIGVPLALYIGLQQAIINGWIHGGYRAQRFIAFMNPFGNASGSGSQLVNSYYAISNGGIFGVGLGNSVQKMGYLPEPNTDFIMSITSEELGLVGVTAILILLLILICRMIQLGVRSNSLYVTLICYGTATFFSVETLFNIGGVLGLLPITGVTFPFISYGGSSMLVLSAAVGIIMNISIQQNKRRLEMGSPFLTTK
jgi:cell division protein FtsW